ncbi:bleomycin hydrolase [Ctenocephalides felis]|uniref:bleomycin hydrolase n=1 Tax=Ctenocephalides felis TaxID=7515 RepID=UPI000E6E4F64|nr:bleomycin hydrolase [Ctenocephalides felis]
MNQGTIAAETIRKLRKIFNSDLKNILAQNACSRFDPFEICMKRSSLQNVQHVYKYKVEAEGKPVTHQKQTGRCWLFAAMNALRIPFCKAFNLEEFEFSQSYLFFWDKIERSNYFLHTIAETALRKEPIDGRLMAHLLSNPTNDGGQWDMVLNLINKYGIMPKKCFAESFSSEASQKLNSILKSTLRQYALELRKMVDVGATECQMNQRIEEMMVTVFNIVSICLGLPDEMITWEYVDKSKTYHSIGPITPQEFYIKHVKPIYDFDNKVCLTNDPRPGNPFHKAYTVEFLGNMVGGRATLYNNQPIETLMEAVVKSIKAGEPVWFGCDVAKRYYAKGLHSLDLFDFSLVFGVNPSEGMSKADRLLYGDSCMTHAMVITACSADENNIGTKFRVENSWGEDRGEKGYLMMSGEWFKEFVFEVVVDRSHLSPSILEVFNQTPMVLPAWDPMGTLANSN